MSTYLVAYANGPFQFVESSYTSPISGIKRPLRVYGTHFSWTEGVSNPFYSATSDNIHQVQFALDVKAKLLPLYEKVFDIEYKLPKLDTLVVSNK